MRVIVILAATALLVAGCGSKSKNSNQKYEEDTLAATHQLAKSTGDENAATNETAERVDVVVSSNQNGISISLNNKTIATDELANTLTDLLATWKNIPDSVAVKYTGEVLMGTRAEVETEVAEGITRAKNIKYKPYVKAIEPLLMRELKVPTTLQIDYFKKQADIVFLTATMMNPAGGEVDLGKTAKAQVYEGGAYSTSVFALLKNNDGKWNITAISIGATDMPIVCWWKEFNTPKSLFPEGMVADDCL